MQTITSRSELADGQAGEPSSDRMFEALRRLTQLQPLSYKYQCKAEEAPTAANESRICGRCATRAKPADGATFIFLLKTWQCTRLSHGRA